jgi:MFS family permease
VRGVVDLAINGTFWLGAIVGAGMSIVLLDPAFVGPEIGWRLAFAFGAVLSIAILLVRRNVPESPRWLITHGRHEEAEAVVAKIEAEIAAERGSWPRATAVLPMALRAPVTWGEILRLMATRLRRRAIVGLALMTAQAFFYNAIFFTYALIMTRFYGVPDDKVGYYIFPFALGNFFGPLLLGRLFDSVGRRAMIAATYALSGIGLFAMGYAFAHEALTATTQVLSLCAIFFIASAAASSAYLTVSEIFPVEIRAVSISLFYAIGTGAGGLVAPALFGAIVETGSREALFAGFALAALLMCGAAVVAAAWGVDAERKPLEEIARPLSAP